MCPYLSVYDFSFGVRYADSRMCRHKAKGLGTEKIIESVVKIHTDGTGEKIMGVEDRWNGDTLDGPIATVESSSLTDELRNFIGIVFKGATQRGFE